MKKDAEAEGARWLAQARADLDDGLFLAQGGRYNIACFIAQQAAEKALKAYLFAQGAAEVWGHSVAELCDRCAGVEATFHPLRGDAALLDKYYIPTRYPNGLPGGIPKNAFDEVEATRSLTIAAKVIEVVARLLSP